jgi:CheY-like chemotaxis protein
MTTWKSVLITNDNVEHNEIFNAIFSEVMPTVQYSLHNNGTETIKHLLSGKIALPDALIINADLPHLDGLDCLAMLRSAERFNALPIIVCSKHPNLAKIEAAYQMGATHFWVKTGTPDEIKQQLLQLSTTVFATHTRTSKAAFVLGSTHLTL